MLESKKGLQRQEITKYLRLTLLVFFRNTALRHFPDISYFMRVLSLKLFVQETGIYHVYPQHVRML